jgi:HSP20 family molecular chaperone IbpA
MQSTCKPLARKLSQQALRTKPNKFITITPICSLRPITTSPKMSIFSRNLYPGDTSFTPLFRLLDDFDNYRSEVAAPSGQEGNRRITARTFNPKFDVRETENAYELHGELPGIERENVTIEFTEPQTIVIHGKVERTYQAGTPPAGLLEGGDQTKGAITEGGEQQKGRRESHKATVADEESEKAKEAGTVTKQEPKQQQVEKHKQQEQPKEKFWVTERSIGEFSRAFSFPTRVDQDGVQASLKDGILSVIVPKAKKHESRRINVN